MSKSRLEEVWARLSALNDSLWKDNSARAVESQALLEEFRNEMLRFDRLVVQAQETMAQMTREHDQSLASLRSHYEAEAAGLRKRVDLLERSLKEKDSEIEKLVVAVNDQEKRTADFQAGVVKMAADSEVAVAKKMEDLYHDLRAKESVLEQSWEKRSKELEAEAARERELLEAKRQELDAWEKRRRDEDAAAKRRAVDLDLKQQALQNEYRVKQQEIETLKESLQKSISELVRQYQAKLKGETPPPARR